MEKKTLMAMGGSPRTRPLGSRPWRWAKTLFFLASMLASLLLDCAPPLLVVVLDLLFPAAVVSAAAADSPLSAASMSRQLRSFSFRSSLVDLPIVSALRSLLILCAFLSCGGSRGVYLCVASACSSASVVYVLLKVSSMSSAVADSSLPGVEPRRVLALAAGDDAAAVEMLFLASVAMAIAHVVAAYRTSCRERRKMLVYRIDVEAVKVKGGLIKGDIKL
ncbi:uncharacterized protein LOC121992875 [Zingiber officinale]|uniref:MENTAL domain-containing protein n=1 Tax=Zingiber officinale TaxID=94328 RepID=A0A8J5G5U7_ZINOF|nr:uncharacterized protein LOC121992875 [Zingiber officinale]KAG6496309.1 hypothetical protein ZIOFF_044170 [Zingiber officinale]